MLYKSFKQTKFIIKKYHFSDLVPRPDSESLSKSEKLKKILDEFYKPPTYEESLVEYNKFLSDISKHSEFKKLFFLSKITKLRKENAKREKSKVRFHTFSIILMAGFLGSYLIINFIKKTVIKYNGKLPKLMLFIIESKIIELITEYISENYSENLQKKLESNISDFYVFYIFQRYFLESFFFFYDYSELKKTQIFSELILSNIFKIYDVYKIQYDGNMPTLLTKIYFLIKEKKAKLTEIQKDILLKRLRELNFEQKDSSLIIFLTCKILICSNFSVNSEKLKTFLKLKNKLPAKIEWYTPHYDPYTTKNFEEFNRNIGTNIKNEIQEMLDSYFLVNI